MAKARTLADTQQCPFCGGWIEMPSRRRRQFMERHQRECDKKAYRKRNRDFAIKYLGGSS